MLLLLAEQDLCVLKVHLCGATETILFTESYSDIRLICHFCVYTLSTVDPAVF